MTTVKFDRSVKYKGVRYDAHEVFQVDDNDVAQLKEAGATVLATETVAPDPQLRPQCQSEDRIDGAVDGQEGEDVDKLREELLGYTVSELTRFAHERGIDLKGKTRKADIYNIIVAALN